MKKAYLFLGLILGVATASATSFTRFNDVIIKNQMSVGSNSAPTTSSIVDIASTKSGVLAPRMTTTQKNAIASTATGLHVFDTTLGLPSWYGGASWMSPQTNALTNAHIWVGQNGTAADVAMSGDTTIASSGATTIAANAVTNAKMATMSNNTVKGNTSGGTATPSDLALSDVTETGSGIDTISNGSKAIVGGSNLTIKHNLTSGHIYVGQSGNVPADTAMSGDVTIASSGSTTIGANAVTNAKMATMATQTFKGRTTAGTGNAEDLTATQATAILNTMVGDSGSGGTKGLVPAPASGDAAASKFLKADGTWSTAGSGSGTGSINYITNGDAETDTSGWATFSDTAGNVPIDGTGGTATGLTFSRSTTSPLRDTGSFLIQQTNSTNIQGKGVSYDFTIASADQAHMLSITFNYNASSTFVASDGTTAPSNDGTTTTNAGNSDIEAFVYDVTNAVLLPVSPQVITANGSNNFDFKAQFQTSSNSLSYRFILMAAKNSANATGYSFKFDHVIIGPNAITWGYPGTGWTAYTPTFTGFGTVSTQEFYYRRDGPNVQIQGYFVAGTTTATEARISLPSGLTSADATYITNRREVGRMNVGAANGSATILTETSKTYFTMGADNSSTDGTAKANGNSLATSGNSISLFVSGIPIQGWASTVQMSNEAPNRPVVASIALAADYAVSANAVVKFDTVLFDPFGVYSTSTGLYTAPVSGYYQVSATMSTTSTAAGFYVGVNGTAKVYLTTPSNSPYGGSQLVKATAGDTIGVYSDSAKTVDGTSTPYFSVFSIAKVGDPSAIAGTDAVSAHYHASSTSLSSALATINWTTSDWDDHSGMSSGTYTVATAGKYQVNSGLLVTGTISLNNTLIMEIQKNGTVWSRKTIYAPATLTDIPINVSDAVSAVPGDTIRIQVSTTFTGPSIVSSNSDNYFSIFRAGN